MGETAKGTRNSAIELYRILLMLGIVILHVAYVSKGAGPFHWLNTGMAWCVDGFVFITGYFGCRFSLQKIVRLYGTAIWCGLVIVLLWFLIAKYGCLSGEVMEEIGIAESAGWTLFDFLKAVINHINGSWFLHAYVLMMCMVPLVNLVIDKCTAGEFAILSTPFLIAVFGWGLATELPILHCYVPKNPGLGSMTGLTLLGCYIWGRLYRLYEDKVNLRFLSFLFILAVLLLIDTLGYGWFGRYSSPFAVATATVVFNLFKRIAISSGLSKCILYLSPSMFAIYILHGYAPCLKLMRLCSGNLQRDIPLEICMIMVAALMFLVCLFLDLTRRSGLFMITRCFRA